MGIEKVERFYCPICDYMTEYEPIVEQIKKDGICPACQNGKGHKWEKKIDWKDKVKKRVPFSTTIYR
jgi:hypothetical protein